jgi:uncharacterized protein (TIGR03435 family)
VLNAPSVDAQEVSGVTTAPEFDVASVKPNTSGEMRVMMRNLPGGIYEAYNVTLGAMVRQAYRLQQFQLVGGPAWLDADRFTIQARSPAGSAPSEFALRMRSLLAERFSLQVHNETRELPIYALVVARADGRLGSQLRPASIDCTALVAARGRGGAPPPPPPAPPRPGERPQCGTMMGGGRVFGGGATMPQLATTLSQFAGRMVFDRTGLTGGFDFDLEFAPDPGLRGIGPGGGLPGPPDVADRPADAGISIFTAVQEQLGLRLEAERGPVEVVVIDRVEQPTADDFELAPSPPPPLRPPPPPPPPRPPQ